jgi:hypothetical protein
MASVSYLYGLNDVKAVRLWLSEPLYVSFKRVVTLFSFIILSSLDTFLVSHRGTKLSLLEIVNLINYDKEMIIGCPKNLSLN